MQGNPELARSTLLRAIKMVQQPHVVTYIEAGIRQELDNL
jgi:hypothetical protein